MSHTFAYIYLSSEISHRTRRVQEWKRKGRGLARDTDEKLGRRQAEKSPAELSSRDGNTGILWSQLANLITAGLRRAFEDRDTKRGESSNHGVRAIVWPSQHEGSLRIPSANFTFDLSACRYLSSQREVVHPWPSSP